MSTNEWTSESSEVFRQLASVAVPRRAEQIATLLTLIPADRSTAFKVVELASGEGYLSQAILTAFPKATVLALDGEATMRAATAQRLSRFGGRGAVDAFDMARDDWYGLLDGADCVVSSLCVHHLDGQGKQVLFKAVCARLTANGALLIADIVHSPRVEANEVYAAQWDHSAEAQAREQDAQIAYDYFVSEKWNHYRYPDPFDQPSPLFDQLVWLKDAGFAAADCFWLYAGHAIYGGYKGADVGDSFGSIPFAEALVVVETVLRD
jgi:tRNA (cmo5U34)-methyltransferase